MVFALDSPEREKREGSTTPCGVKGVVGTSSRAQPGSDERRKQNVHFNGQQRAYKKFALVWYNKKKKENTKLSNKTVLLASFIPD